MVKEQIYVCGTSRDEGVKDEEIKTWGGFERNRD